MGKPKSPGPVYMLPPTVGYNKHDYTRYRNPQYTMSPRVYPPGAQGMNPGPQYLVRGMNEHGKASPPAYSLSSRHKQLKGFASPGPGTYSPEQSPRMKEQRPPAYSIAGRHYMPQQNIGPGPLAYNLPSMLGPKVPNKPALGAYTMTGRHGERKLMDSPGPASYQRPHTNIYMYKQPQYTLPPRLTGVTDKGKSPGPAAYFPSKIPGRDPPKYTMAPRYNDAYSPYITAEDNIPCIEH